MRSSRVIEAPPIGEPVNNLPVQVSLVVPSSVGEDQVDREVFEERVENTKKWFSERFGGDTTTRGDGDYVMDDELIEEPVAIVESSTSIEKYKQKAEELAKFIRTRRQVWGQDTIAYKIEGRVFIYPKREYIDHDKTVTRDLIKVL